LTFSIIRGRTEVWPSASLHDQYTTPSVTLASPRTDNAVLSMASIYILSYLWRGNAMVVLCFLFFIKHKPSKKPHFPVDKANCL
ncbi:MAG: hypothetical protein ABS888_06085, partial [Eubacteriales bacterium]